MNLELFKMLRKRNNLSARELSVKAGLSPSYVAKVESGSISPSVPIFVKLMKCLDCSIHEVYLIMFSEDSR